MKRLSYLLLSCLYFAVACSAQNKPTDKATLLTDPGNARLRQQLEDLIRPFKARIGIAVLSIEDRDTLTLNNNYTYPMQSTYKFPLAMAVLQQVDQGKLSLTQKIPVKKTDLRKTWSPLRDKYPEGNVSLSLAELLEYTVSMSDNNTCDILFRLIKGPAAAEKCIRQWGIRDMAIKTTEQEMTTGWEVQYRNHSTPYAMITLLDLFYGKKQLSASSTAFLSRLMTESSNSAKRIKGALPPEAIVAHKTGTSDTNDKGLTAATNDVGIVTLPDGKHFAIAVFITDSKETGESNEKMIALVAANVYSALGMRSVGAIH